MGGQWVGNEWAMGGWEGGGAMSGQWAGGNAAPALLAATFRCNAKLCMCEAQRSAKACSRTLRWSQGHRALVGNEWAMGGQWVGNRVRVGGNEWAMGRRAKSGQ